MKKLFVFASALAFASTVGAQKVVTDDIHGTKVTEMESTNHGTNPETNYKRNGAGLEYFGVDGGFALNLNFKILDYLSFGCYFGSGETNEYVKENSTWGLNLGGHYRYWFGKYLFAEAEGGLVYGHAKVKSEYVEASNGNIGLYLTPRIGLKLCKLWGTDLAVVAGYRWHFSEFKFSKENIGDFFTVGLAWVM